MNLGLNFHEHPTRKRLYVFHFKVEQHAQLFEKLLAEKAIPYEHETNEEEGVLCHFYGIKKEHFPQAQKVNYLVSAQFRKPFIPDAGLRYFVIFLVLTAITLGIIGALRS
jgi:hypothetical protein